MSDVKLKPCPFCGETTQFWHFGRGSKLFLGCRVCSETIKTIEVEALMSAVNKKGAHIVLQIIEEGVKGD